MSKSKPKKRMLFGAVAAVTTMFSTTALADLPDCGLGVQMSCELAGAVAYFNARILKGENHSDASDTRREAEDRCANDAQCTFKREGASFGGPN